MGDSGDGGVRTLFAHRNGVYMGGGKVLYSALGGWVSQALNLSKG